MPEMERPGDGAARWVDVVAEASRRLVDRGLGEDRVAAVLELIGTAVGADGAAVFEVTSEHGAGRPLVTHRYEWLRDHPTPNLEDPSMRELPAEELFAGWGDRLAAGEAVCQASIDFLPATRDHLEARGIASIVVVPIRIQGFLWGSVGLTSRSRERRWDEGETLLLTAVAGAIGASVVRGRAERQIQVLQKRMEYLLEATGTGLDIIDADHNVHFVDPSWMKVYGDFRGRKCHEYFFGDACPHEGCGVTQAIAENRVVRTERSLPREGGRIIEVVSIPFQEEGGGWLAAEINIDVTEKQATRHAVEDHRAFQAVLASVRGVGFGEDEEALTRAFLGAVVREYGFRMAWYGRFADEAVRPTYWAGLADRYLEGLVLKIRNPEHPDARCAMSQAILSGKPFGYADLRNDEGFRRWRDYALELGYGSNLAIPVEVEGRIEGGVMVYSGSPGAFSTARTERLSLLVREMGSLLGGRRRWRRAENQLLVQRDLALRLSGTVTSKEALDLCLDAALRASGMDCGGAYLVDPQTGDLDLECWRNLSDAFVETIRHYPADSQQAHYAKVGMPIYMKLEEFAGDDIRLLSDEGLRCVAVLPVVHGNRTVARLNVASRHLEEVPESVRNILEVIAFQIGTSLTRIQAQESLRESEHLYRTTVDSMAEWLQVVDSDCRIVLVNEAFRQVNREVGLSGDPIGQRPWEFYAFLPPQVREEYGQVFRTGKALTTEEDITEPGRTLRTRTAKIPIFDAGRVVGIITIVHDITKQVQAEKDRDRLEAQMQQSQKFESLGVLAGGVAHDFNNLLTGIIGHCELALLEIPQGGRARSRVQKIRAAAQRAADLTRQLLDCAGKGGREVEPLDLNALVQEMSDLLEASIPKRTRVAYRLSKGLPAAEGDPTQLRQVVMNLILNASEAIGDAGGDVTVRTSWGWMNRGELAGGVLPGDIEEGTYTTFEVTDSGCGMDEETVRKIFDPFFTTKFAGRGLGLAAVLGIVRGHRGTIQVRSHPGEGTTFRVLLPASAGLPQGWSEEVTAGAPRWDGALAIVGEGEATVRDLVRERLEAHGFQVKTAADAGTLLDFLGEGGVRPEVLLVDLDLVGPEGLDAVARAAETPPGFPLIFTSAIPEVQALGGRKPKAAFRFLPKPYGARELLRTLRDLLG